MNPRKKGGGAGYHPGTPANKISRHQATDQGQDSRPVRPTTPGGISTDPTVIAARLAAEIAAGRHDHAVALKQASAGMEPGGWKVAALKQCQPVPVARQRASSDGRESFRRFVAVALTGEWIPWAEFVNRAWQDLTSRAEVRDTLDAWRKARTVTLTELTALGLAATVERTDRSIALGDHEADLSGLVRLHLPGVPAPSPHGWLSATQTAYAERMHRSHGLTPCEGLRRSLRAFCGQVRPVSNRWPGDRVVTPLEELEEKPLFDEKPWMDHTASWLDVEGLPVLTAEPYDFNPLAVVRELADLPLDVKVHPGVWNDGTTLMLCRWDCDKPPLKAELKILVERFDHKTRELVRVYA